MVRGGASLATLEGRGRGVCAAADPTSPPSRARLIAVRTAIIGRRVIRSFLRNEDVMRMTLLHRRGADLNESSARPQFLNRSGPAVTHAGSQSTDHLLHEWTEQTLVGHS